MKEVVILIGNYGSGKTELALNFAFQAANEGKKVELLDLDMVNTYFRLTDRGELIKSKEIRLVSPNFVNSSVETLSLPAEVASAFALDWDTVIFDVGGDPAGATALGRYHEDFAALPEGSLKVLNVVNTRRPMAGTPEKLVHLMRDMERHSRQRVSGFVNNTNLARLACAEDLRDGYEIIREASLASGVPVLYTTGNTKISELMRILQRNKAHMAVVVDEYGGTEGIATLEDIVEELVGDIWDEHDEVIEEFKKQEDGSYLIACSADLDDMFDLFAVKGACAATTVSGWVMEQVGRVPEEGDHFQAEGLDVIVTRVEHRRVIEIQVRVLPEEEPETK